jgi:ribonuclease BN (tRNA processing enzyme)
MKVRVLGCSGSIARGKRTTSYLIDDDILVDAGTGVGDLTVSEMLRIDHVFITHAHLDHITALPFMLDTMGMRRKTPVQVHALPETIAAMKAHVMNNVIWPDFSRIPSPKAPFMDYVPIRTGQTVKIAGRHVEALSAKHTVPAVGYAVTGKDGKGKSWVFTGDTGPNPAFWKRVNKLDRIGMLVIETAFSRKESKLAEISQHLSPDTLAAELAHIPPERDYPIYITHLKPAEARQIMVELRPLARNYTLHSLKAGEKFNLA